MIVNDPALNIDWLDYGVLIPFPPRRPSAILNFLGEKTASFPGPVIEMPLNKVFASYDDIRRVHEESYCNSLLNGGASLEIALQTIYELIDEEGRPCRYDKLLAKKTLVKMFSEMVLPRLYGTCFAANTALEDKKGFCYYLSGGNHHARYSEGAGFCVLNDMMIAARKLQAQGRVHRIWIIDVDAHKACGTAELNFFIKNGSPCGFEEGAYIYTLCVHMAQGWPLDAKTLSSAKPGRAPLINCDVDIPVAEGEEPLYAKKLTAGLKLLEEKTKTETGAEAEFAFVVDGSDPYEHDELESSALLKLTLSQCVERDMIIYDFLRTRNIPCVWVLSGGYGKRAWEPPAHFLAELCRHRG
ncbi:MAG: hypothetical protein LBG79_02420 [Spirochaetaceae bacterium]|jgi:acetoin utilization deacetylase AcuC-like enzyme|nr:hypothetical protein [Spirochaetaceae bacterium]